MTKQSIKSISGEIRKELFIKWKNIRAITLRPNDKKFENVPNEWPTFEDFYNDNYQRYLKAKKKWINYINLTEPTGKSKYKLVNTHIIRKVKSLGFTKDNTVFTSPSDRMKYHRTSKKIYIGDKLLGTRDVKNILKKKGIDVASPNAINQRINNNVDPFKMENRLHKYKWKGEYLPLHAIAKKEQVNPTFFKNKVIHDKMDLRSALNHCKSYVPSKYEFEGDMLYPNEIFKILSIRHGISEKTLVSRFYKNGCDYTKIIYKTSNSKYAPYPKKVIAKKGAKSIEFKSVIDACKSLKINRPSATNYLNGKLKNTNQTKGYILIFA